MTDRAVIDRCNVLLPSLTYSVYTEGTSLLATRTSTHLTRCLHPNCSCPATAAARSSHQVSTILKDPSCRQASSLERPSNSPTSRSSVSKRAESASRCVLPPSKLRAGQCPRKGARGESAANERPTQIACYSNTVRAWRTGAQTDLSEVIQIESVFTNVSKGAVASADDLQRAFGTSDVKEVMMQILKKGELQVGEKERAVELEELRREICTEVASRCVDPNTQRPHTVGMIEKAMNEIGYNVQGSKVAKAQASPPTSSLFSHPLHLELTGNCPPLQALDLIKVLQAKKTLPIARAQMRVRVTMSSKEGKKLKEKIMPLVTKVEDDEWSEEWELVRMPLLARVDPVGAS